MDDQKRPNPTLGELFPDLAGQEGKDDLVGNSKIVLRKRKEVEYLEKLLDAAKKEKSIAENALLLKMTEKGVQSFKNEDGILFYTEEKTFYRVKKDDTEDLHEWLRKNQLGDMIKVEESVHPGTLNSFFNREFKEEEYGIIPEFVNIHEEKRLKVKK